MTPRSGLVRRRVRAAALAAVAATVATLAAASPAAAEDRPTGPLTVPEGTYLGAGVNEDLTDPDTTQAELNALEGAMGRPLAIAHRFYAYNEEPIDGRWERTMMSQGRIPLVTWGAFDTYKLVDGSQDAFIRRQADSLRDVGDRLFLRFYHEPDGDYRASIVHSPADYIAAFRHVHDLFVEEGATNVVWVWCPTAWKFTTTSHPSIYYPGDDVVDWIGVDGYNWFPTKSGSSWRTFKQVFANWYAWAKTQTRPLMISEFGVLEDPYTPGRKATWLHDALTSLQNDFPLIQAANYFDTQATRSPYTYNWRLTTSEDALDAWADIAADPYLSPEVPALTPGPDPGTVDYITNPGVESDLTGWGGKTGGAKAAVTRDTSTQRTGAASIKVANTSSSGATVGVGDNPKYLASTIAGGTYTASAWVYSTRAGQVVKVTLKELRGSTTVGSSVGSVTLSGSGWQLLSTTRVAAQDESGMVIQFTGYTPAGGSFYVDDISLTAP